MFLDFYHLQEQPFGDAPDPRFIYLAPTHREALAALLCGIEMDRSFLALISEPGLGKTTLLSELLERLRHSARTVLLFQDKCDSLDLVYSLVHSLGGDASGLGMGGLLAMLYKILVQQAHTGKRLVLVIDEAQNLDESVLETVRLLSNYEMAGTTRIQIILSGQPLLAEKLASPDLVQLRQRISNWGRLSPFDAAETARYVEHRLAIAGHLGDQLFTRDAIELIALASQGIPRIINNLCTNALLLGYAQNREQIDTGIVDEAVSDLDLNAPAPKETRQPVAGAIFAPKFFDPLEAKRTFLRKSLGRVALAAALILVVLFDSSWSGSSAKMSQEELLTASADALPSTLTGAPKPWEVGSSASASPSQPQETNPGQNLTTEESPHTFTVIVAPRQTLRQICLQNVGRFDAQLVAKIQKLNPWMEDPNHLEIGQRIQLPRPVTTLGKVSPAKGAFDQATGKEKP